ncbi:MAG: ABC transporter permease subunit, partial [Chloroflexota bacterium]
IIVIVYAYGFQVTEINLAEPKEETRQQQLTNVLRALARPDLTEYDIDRVEVNAPILVPCPTTMFDLPEIEQPEATIQISTKCADGGSEITVSGDGFLPGDDVLLFFVPYKEDESEEVQLPLADDVITPNTDGSFSQQVELRKDRTSENPQKIRAVVNRQVGLPRPSEAVYDTIEKIIETVFLALIATTLGTALAIPISFLAARNLMIQVTSLFGSFAAIITMAAVGWFLGAWLFSTVGGWGVSLILGGTTPTGSLMIAPILLLLTVQTVRSQASGTNDLARSYGFAVIGALVVAFVWGLIAGLGQLIGTSLTTILGNFGFLGNFLFVISDALAVFLPAVGGLVGLFALASLGGTLAESLLRRTGETIFGKLFVLIMSTLAGAVLVGLPAALLTWLYEFSNPWISIGWPALIGGVILGLVGLLFKVGLSVPTGMIIYYTTRTILNILRAIEPLIMAIVFVVWVGIGPFAGVMALMLHTIAALGKLYSEQVENISQGPIEAVTATGANRLQTIIYAVIPQIVPPYIAFTIYRWDINVRMSTIIGFAGGGGIGFLLQQNLNLLKYSQASVQMIAIAIIVSSLDFVSAKIRERII